MICGIEFVHIFSHLGLNLLIVVFISVIKFVSLSFDEVTWLK